MSLTVIIFSAASSGISQPSSPSKAMASSIASRLSAPRSLRTYFHFIGRYLAEAYPVQSITAKAPRSPLSAIADTILERGAADSLEATQRLFCHPRCCPSPTFAKKDRARRPGKSNREALRLGGIVPWFLLVAVRDGTCNLSIGFSWKFTVSLLN